MTGKGAIRDGKKKYDGRGNTRKCGRKAVNVFISKREFFKSARVNASTHVQPVTVSL